MRKRHRLLRTVIIVLSLTALSLLAIPRFRSDVSEFIRTYSPIISEQPAISAPDTEASEIPKEFAEIHVIDIGQGDSTLIKASDCAVLVDAGPKSNSEKLLTYLSDTGTDKLDALILSHPHEDHIGGAPSVLETLKVSEIIMPDVVSNTKTFERLLDGAEEHNVPISTVFKGDKFNIGSLDFEILSPDDEDYSNMNNNSIVMKVTFGDTSFMLTGDAELNVEKELLASYSKDFLDCDYLKVAHHGSSSSSSEEFVRAVSPEFASISCGADNDYGHPHAEVTALLKQLKITYSRTDTDGSTVYISDGKSLRIKSFD